MKTVKNIKRYLIGILMLMPLAALADGEQRDIKGATWVKPVEYLEIDRAKFNMVQLRDPATYIFGHFDINELAKAKDVQIVGMKLKPKFMRVDNLGFLGRTEREYQNFEESAGIGHINSESFCIYTDKGVDRNYEVDYQSSTTILYTAHRLSRICGWFRPTKVSVSIMGGTANTQTMVNTRPHLW